MEFLINDESLSIVDRWQQKLLTVKCEQVVPLHNNFLPRQFFQGQPTSKLASVYNEGSNGNNKTNQGIDNFVTEKKILYKVSHRLLAERVQWM